MTVTELFHDYETYSEANLPDVGLDSYLGHPSARVLMLAWSFDHGSTLKHWQRSDGPFPREVKEALLDPQVVKKAFNAQFERNVARKLLHIDTPIQNWRCTQVLAYAQSFTGGLDDICKQIELPDSLRKDKNGKRLLKLFSQPQRVTKNQPHRVRDQTTDPEDWSLLCGYNKQDVAVEIAVDHRLGSFPMLDSEWELYEIDQQINDDGVPIDMLFVRHALAMAERRQAELQERIQELTGVANPNSVTQLLPWLRERGYWFNDLRADTVKKVLAEDAAAVKENGYGALDADAMTVLKLRQWAARTSTDKYAKLVEWVGEGDRARYMFQFGGASRTNRWAGRGMQPQNLPRTPKILEDEHGDKIAVVADIIRADDYEGLGLWIEEPLQALVGSVRSSIRAPEGYIFDICDLAAIESRVIGWITGCVRLNRVFEEDRDPYKDFGQDLYNKSYDAVTKGERSNSKPAVLGAGYRLGGGDLREGKRTGLWGYAENMGVDLTREESHRMVQLFREKYDEIPDFWYELERATIACVRTGRPQTTGPVTWEYLKPYLTAVLPSGRRLYYYRPRVDAFEAVSRAGKPYTKYQLSYMGQSQLTKQWQRLESHGGLLIENLVQAIARDVLKEGIMRAWDAGFRIIMHVHDEIVTLRRHRALHEGSHDLGATVLRYLMKKPIAWAPGLLLDAAAFTATIYRKD